MAQAKRPVQRQMGELGQRETQQAAGGGQRQPWEQQPGEPHRWFGRFQVFLELGPTRTLQKAARRASGDAQAPGLGFANQLWCRASRSWQWRARAAAWDVHQRELFALGEYNARLARQQRRLALIEEQLERVCAALEQANIDNLDLEEARALFPQTRVYLRDLLAAERLEDVANLLNPADAESAVLITADDLIAAQRQLEARQREGAANQPACDRSSEPALFTAGQPPSASAAAAARPLLVCAAPQCALGLDLDAWRGVRAASGLQFQRILTGTQVKFAEHLRRERGLGRPVELLHMAVPAFAAGVAFIDGVADAPWLSARLAGVRVMLVASWTGAMAGEWLGAVPFVVALGEGIEEEGAAAFCCAFWRGIGLGLEPGAALDDALQQCPPAVREFVVRHG